MACSQGISNSDQIAETLSSQGWLEGAEKSAVGPAQDALYGGTWEFVHHELVRLGISYTVVDARAPQTWHAALRPTTKAGSWLAAYHAGHALSVCSTPPVAAYVLH